MQLIIRTIGDMVLYRRSKTYYLHIFSVLNHPFEVLTVGCIIFDPAIQLPVLACSGLQRKYLIMQGWSAPFLQNYIKMHAATLNQLAGYFCCFWKFKINDRKNRLVVWRFISWLLNVFIIAHGQYRLIQMQIFLKFNNLSNSFIRPKYCLHQTLSLSN